MCGRSKSLGTLNLLPLLPRLRLCRCNINDLVSYVRHLGFEGCPATMGTENPSTRDWGQPRPEQVARIKRVLDREMQFWQARCGDRADTFAHHAEDAFMLAEARKRTLQDTHVWTDTSSQKIEVAVGQARRQTAGVG